MNTLALKVKFMQWGAKMPTVGHAGEDLAYDLYALDNQWVFSHAVTKVRTGISAVFDGPGLICYGGESMPLLTKWGLLIRDRSSMTEKNIVVVGGVIDSGYRGEIIVTFANVSNKDFLISKDDKIAQMIPMPVLTAYPILEVESLPDSSRKTGGFGSTGNK